MPPSGATPFFFKSPDPPIAYPDPTPVGVIPPAVSYQDKTQEPVPRDFSNRQRLYTTIFNPTRIANGEGDTLSTVVFDIELVRVVKRGLDVVDSNRERTRFESTCRRVRDLRRARTRRRVCRHRHCDQHRRRWRRVVVTIVRR